MSGFEIVGVLAVLPVAVEVAHKYRFFFASRAKVAAEIDQLANDILVEHVRLRSSCEKLLSGIIPPSMIYPLLDNPDPEKWMDSEYKDRIRARLWTSSKEVDGLLKDMKKAACELEANLKIQDGKAVFLDKKSILGEIKAKSGFSLKKKDYDGILNRIRAGNAVLSDIAKSNCDLEPTRQRFSQHLLIRLLRGLAANLHAALKSALLTCACSRHNVSLQLAVRNSLLLPGDDTETKSRDFEFHVALGSSSHESASLNDNDDEGTLQPCHGLRLQRGDFGKAATGPTLTAEMGCDPIVSHAMTTSSGSFLAGDNHGTRGSKLERFTKSVKFMLPQLSTTSTSTSTSTSTAGTSTLQSSVTQLPVQTVQTRMPILRGTRSPAACELRDICGAIKKSCCTPTDAYGYIRDAEDKEFGVYPHGDLNMAGTRTITLREVLVGEGTCLPPFDCEERLKVAASLAASVLHLYDTPWIARIVTLDNVYFLMSNGDLAASCNGRRAPYGAFVSVSLPDHEPEPEPVTATATQLARPASLHSSCYKRPINVTSLSLGATLIQIMVGRPIEELEVTPDMDTATVLARCRVGTQYRDTIIVGGSDSYWNAVAWCLRSVAGIAGFDDEKFCQGFYEGVVAPLEVAHGEMASLKDIDERAYRMATGR